MSIWSWFKSKMFGGRIIRTVGTVEGSGKFMLRTELKVHVLEPKDPKMQKAVGIEFVAKSFLSYQMMPITLSIGESRKLIGFLEDASR
jgi:hypothetical protein